MNMLRFISMSILALGLISSPGLKAQAPALSLDFTGETLGAEPKTMLPMVGFWTVAKDGENLVLKVDGGKWQEGQSGSNLADKARAIYGERYAEFLDSVKAFAYFSYVVAKGVEGFGDGEISVRFKPLAGRVDQGAGILFNLKPNGDYLSLRANALENNLVLWKVVKGKRSSVKWVRNTPTATQQWHDLKVVVRGTKVEGYLDGKLWLEHGLDQPVSGKVGLWSKADSVVLFDDFKVKSGR